MFRGAFDPPGAVTTDHDPAETGAILGLTGTEFNSWHKPGGSQQDIQVWRDPALDARTVCIPDPDPGEDFTDIRTEIHGLTADGATTTGGPTMGGFVDKLYAPAADRVCG